MISTRYLVVGAGLAGASTAWHLAERGEEVVLVERTEPAAVDGSSHGSARIFRYAYPQRVWVERVVAAAHGWRELERLCGRTLLTPASALNLGDLRDPRTLAAVLAEVGVDHELLDAATAQARWPQLAVDSEVLHTPGGAVIDAEGAVHAMVERARSLGAGVLTGWPLQRLERTGSGLVVHAADGRSIEAERVVVTAGGWLPDLLGALALPDGFVAAVPPLQVREENAFHFPYREDVSPPDRPGASPAGWPTTIHKDGDVQVYSLPGGRDADGRGQKVAEFNGGRVIPSARARTGTIDPANRARVVEHVRAHLPGLVPEPYAETTCLFTNTPTEDFVMDGADGVTVVSPCSGHGAKFAPWIGQVVADVATGAADPPPDFRVPWARRRARWMG